MEKRRVVNQKDRNELETFSTAPQSPILLAHFNSMSLSPLPVPAHRDGKKSAFFVRPKTVSEGLLKKSSIRCDPFD